MNIESTDVAKLIDESLEETIRFSRTNPNTRSEELLRIMRSHAKRRLENLCAPGWRGTLFCPGCKGTCGEIRIDPGSPVVMRCTICEISFVVGAL